MSRDLCLVITDQGHIRKMSFSKELSVALAQMRLEVAHDQVYLILADHFGNKCSSWTEYRHSNKYLLFLNQNERNTFLL